MEGVFLSKKLFFNKKFHKKLLFFHFPWCLTSDNTYFLVADFTNSRAIFMVIVVIDLFQQTAQ